MSFRKVISAIAAACVLTGSLALGTTDAFAAAPKAAAHKEIVCKPGLTAHQVKVGDKTVWKCGKPAAKKASTKKATTAKAKTKAHPKKATKKTSKKLTCKKGLVAHPVKVNGKTVWKCGKPAAKKPAAKKHATKAHTKKAAVKAPAKKAAPKKASKLTCKKGSTAKKVKKHGKWVWECVKLKPSAKK